MLAAALEEEVSAFLGRRRYDRTDEPAGTVTDTTEIGS